MKHSVILKVFLLSIHTIFTFHLTQSDTTSINCPDIAYLGTSAQITCSTPGNFTNTIYNCPCGVAPQCPAVSGCTNVSGYIASVINQTQTELTIISVQPQHAGNWSCVDKEADRVAFCHLVLAKIPSVNITSDVDADSVNLEDRISLTVDIRDYYCSESYHLTLQLGSVNYTPDTGRNATVKHLTKTVPINVTQAHFGNVTLVFVCCNHQWNIIPEGVNELQPNRTHVPTTLSVGAPTTEITPKDVSTLLIVAAGVTSAVIIILIITIACCCCCCRKKVTRSADKHAHDDLVVTVSQGIRKVAVVCPASEDAVHQAEDNVVVGPGGSASGNDQQRPGLRINPVYIPTTVGGSLESYNSTVTTGTSTETGVMGGDNLHPETRGEYVALDRNAVQPSNIYEHLGTYEEIVNV